MDSPVWAFPDRIPLKRKTTSKAGSIFCCSGDKEVEEKAVVVFHLFFLQVSEFTGVATSPSFIAIKTQLLEASNMIEKQHLPINL